MHRRPGSLFCYRLAAVMLGLAPLVALGAERAAAPDATRAVSQRLDEAVSRVKAARLRLEPTPTRGLSRLVGVQLAGRRVRLIPSGHAPRTPGRAREHEYERPRAGPARDLPDEPAAVAPLGALERPQAAAGATGRLAGRPGDSENPREEPPPPDFPEHTPDGSDRSFTVFRSQEVHSARPSVLKGATPDAIAYNAEPTAANLGGTILATGNLFAYASDNNALSFRFNRQPAGTLQDYEGKGFCCDQVAYAAPRPNGEALLAWVAMTLPDTTNAIVLFTFAGEGPLRSATACAYPFTAPFIMSTGLLGWQFDRPRLASTNRFLFLTFDYGLIEGHPQGSFIVRMDLDDLFDNGRAGCPGDKIDMDVFVEEGDPGIQPVKGAGTTMFLARHHWEALVGDMLRIYTWPDAAAEPSHKDRDVHNYAYSKKGSCPLTNGSDPCQKVQGSIDTGFRAGDTVGWLWTAQQGSGRPFPYVRVAVFETATLDKVVDTDIWSREFAWAHPSAGVNGRGNVGVILYKMGGSQLPTARAFIVKQPRQGWPPPATNALPSAMSTSAPPVDPWAYWGDYGSVNRYDGCPATFLGTGYALRGSDMVARTYWFGEAGEACADLQADNFTFSTDATVGAYPGDEIRLDAKLINSGARSAGLSRFGFYLSADAVHDAGDILLEPVLVLSREVVAGETRTLPTVRARIPNDVAPGGTASPHTLFACADYLDQVDEISEVNNCVARSLPILFR